MNIPTTYIDPTPDFLAIDCGNTHTRLTWLSGGQPSGCKVLPKDEESVVVELIEALGIREVGIASVRGGAEDMVAILRRTDADLRISVLRPDSPLPVDFSHYMSGRTLGVDRIAVAVAASRLYPGKAVLVIDAGTAITSDLITAEGIFEGGKISPGLKMRYEALHRFTARLPLGAPGDYDPSAPFGCSTVESIASGVEGGIMAEVVAAMAQARMRGAEVALLTGGDAAHINSMLPRYKDNLPECISKIVPETVIEPHLLAMGLWEIHKDQMLDNGVSTVI